VLALLLAACSSGGGQQQGKRPPPLVSASWISDRLRKSPYLVPSLLTECDLAELWWLGDTRNRERIPDWWA